MDANKPPLVDELRKLLNRQSAEIASDTPDHVLANFLVGCLAAFNAATQARDKWHGFRPAFHSKEQPMETKPMDIAKLHPMSEPIPQDRPELRVVFVLRDGTIRPHRKLNAVEGEAWRTDAGGSVYNDAGGYFLLDPTPPVEPEVAGKWYRSSERMPSDPKGHYYLWCPSDGEGYGAKGCEDAEHYVNITHWQRIAPPEEVGSE